MKLVMVFMLASIPICCYASGSGCNAMDNAIAQTIDGDVSLEEYHEVIKSYTALPYDKTAVEKFKQCFNDQSEETLDNVNVMVQAIYDSEECSSY
ncbi:secretoglobin family 2A member 2-like [Cricetulus griseus]|uniref:Secretoglobin family 2A member 2-like n=1 Tax=Cricetulus griseus TaxID=10029 RepID=A0A9J7FNV1_CRIGR|nr:secretoglobin family 2A member 2-like [Cricetulus griseus]